MREIWYAIVVATLGVMSADAFVGDQMSRSIGDLGPKLVQAVSVTGEVLASIARPSADELIANKSGIARLLIDLNEQTEAIEQILSRMTESPPLNIEKLDAVKKATLLQLLRPESRADIEKKGTIDMMTVLGSYEEIKVEVRQDAASFEMTLSEIRENPSTRAVNRVGITRGALTASLGRLVTFSGLIQQIAYLPARA
jgi:hypothetical protein